MSFLPKAAPASEQRRLVLDTNVVLDLLLFADPRVAALAAAIASDRAVVLIEPACVEELKRVLRYPLFALAEDAQSSLIARYLGMATQFTQKNADCESLALRCADPDDQKFLELAWRAKASLLTRDKALLRLRRRYVQMGSGVIGLPETLFPASVRMIQNLGRQVSAYSDLGHNFAPAPKATPAKVLPQLSE